MTIPETVVFVIALVVIFAICVYSWLWRPRLDADIKSELNALDSQIGIISADKDVGFEKNRARIIELEKSIWQLENPSPYVVGQIVYYKRTDGKVLTDEPMLIVEIELKSLPSRDKKWVHYHWRYTCFDEGGGNLCLFIEDDIETCERPKP